MSKLILYDWRCPTHGRFERLAKSSVKLTTCPECDQASVRLISAPRIALSGTDPDFPRAYAKWEKTRKQKEVQDKKCYDNHGKDKMLHSYGS